MANKVGTAGNDVLVGTAGTDLFQGFAGDDVIWTEGGNDVVYAGSGNDFIVLGIGASAVFGGEDNDYISSKATGSTIDGGNGVDTVNYGSMTQGISVNMDTGKVYSNGLAGDTLVGIERVQGTSFKDVMAGSSGADWFEGGGGDDHLVGNAGNDQLFGGAGNDVLLGGTGWDRLDGGTGVNQLWLGQTGGVIGGLMADVDIVIHHASAAVVAATVDHVYEFQAAGFGHDQIYIQGSAFTSVAQVLSAMTNVNGDTHIKTGLGSEIVIHGVAPSQLGADDFLLI